MTLSDTSCPAQLAPSAQAPAHTTARFQGAHGSLAQLDHAKARFEGFIYGETEALTRRFFALGARINSDLYERLVAAQEHLYRDAIPDVPESHRANVWRDALEYAAPASVKLESSDREEWRASYAEARRALRYFAVDFSFHRRRTLEATARNVYPTFAVLHRGQYEPVESWRRRRQVLTHTEPPKAHAPMLPEDLTAEERPVFLCRWIAMFCSFDALQWTNAPHALLMSLATDYVMNHFGVRPVMRDP